MLQNVGLLASYKSHKVVRAASILWVSVASAPPLSKVTVAVARLQSEGGGKVLIEVPADEWAARAKTISSADLGWLVVYEGDGYWSWSPSPAFEQGYTLLDQDAPVQAADPKVEHPQWLASGKISMAIDLLDAALRTYAAAAPGRSLSVAMTKCDETRLWWHDHLRQLDKAAGERAETPT